MAQLRLIVEDSLVAPVLDAAISHALMLRVAARELPETLRISRPGPSVAFGKRDVISPSYVEAVEAARAAGFEPTERIAGGRASAFHEGTIHLGHSIHDPDPRIAVTRRFEQTASLVAASFVALGVDAHVGEIPGEYCPGEHSVNARHQTKLMGLGQRVIRAGAHVGAVIVVDGGDRVRRVLVGVYDALDLDWRPDTTGSLTDERPGIAWDQAREAIEAQYAQRYELVTATIDDETLALAGRLAPEHRSVGG